MQHTVTTSGDGSSTLQLTQFGEAYHSTNGAYTEAVHIYIERGLEYLFHNFQSSCPPREVSVLAAQQMDSGLGTIAVFDVGLGTGLNCILAWAWQEQLRRKGLPYPRIIYYGIEKFPIPLLETMELNYPDIIAGHTNILPNHLSEIFNSMHRCPWEEDVAVDSDFILHKSCADIAELGADYYREACSIKREGNLISPNCGNTAAVVFYDTFSPATQPELWNEAIFRNIAAGCPLGSVLVTYCSKGTVKQALRNTGFTLERLAGPPGKRHILRGTL